MYNCFLSEVFPRRLLIRFGEISIEHLCCAKKKRVAIDSWLLSLHTNQIFVVGFRTFMRHSIMRVIITLHTKKKRKFWKTLINKKNACDVIIIGYMSTNEMSNFRELCFLYSVIFYPKFLFSLCALTSAIYIFMKQARLAALQSRHPVGPLKPFNSTLDMIAA